MNSGDYVAVVAFASQPERVLPRKHEHDCEQCCYLGQIHAPAEEKVYDVYSCGSGQTEVLAGRYSSEGPEYVSFPLSVARDIAAMDDNFWSAAVKVYSVFYGE